MQSHLDRYISTLALGSATTPAILSIHDALTVVERWSHRSLASLESLHKESSMKFPRTRWSSRS
jgi:hypothetical protein